ncbi:MAG: pyridoxal phosphate-dependent aminotransferase [Chlorobi bacterium]|nr:pyridoxal phosphate-dependent aminotransferase [Chlorobiota bacterium]
MPRISHKAVRMPASPIRKLVPFAEEAKRKGIHVYHLNIGQPDIQTPEPALNAIRHFDQKVVEYSHSAGMESFRKKLAAYYQGLGANITHNDILVTTGGSEAILFALMACVNPGEEIIIPEPFYTNYNGFAIEAGVKIVSVTSTIENGFALPPVEEIEKKITSKTRGIMICNPNNPTGYLYTREELEKLRDIVKEHDLFLFADEVYREFCYDGREHFSVLHLEDIEENVVLLDSVSKRYSSCGSRIGMLVTRNKAVYESALKFGQARLSPPTFGQVAAEASLETPQSYFDGVYSEYVARRDYLVEALNKIEGVFSPKPGGAFYTIARLPVDDADTFAQWLLSDFSYKGTTVMVAPAAGFYATPGLGKDEVRIAYVLNVEDLKHAVACLEEALKVYHNNI